MAQHNKCSTRIKRLYMEKIKTNNEFKKVSGRILDPIADAQTKNVFNNINISDDIAHNDKQPLNQIIKQTRVFSANQRSDREIKASLRDLS